MALSITARPTSDVEDDTNVSYWNAVGAKENKVVFTFHRKDYTISSVEDYQNTVRLTHTGTDLTGEIIIGDYLYFSSTLPFRSKVGKVTGVSYTSGDTIIDLDTKWPDGSATDSGSNHINLTSARDDYAVDITLYDINRNIIVESVGNQPNAAGILSFDVSAITRAELVPDDDCTYSFDNEPDGNQSFAWYMTYQESYGGTAQPIRVETSLYYSTYTAQQFLSDRGTNMGDYVAFNADLGEVDKAKFLSDFVEPTFFPNYPFTMGFIFEPLSGLSSLKRIESQLDRNKQITGSSTTNLDSTDYTKINRLQLEESYGSGVKYLDVWLEDTTPPSDPCAHINGLTHQERFINQDWVVNVSTGALVRIYVNLNPASGISSIDSYPNGTVKDSGGSSVGTVTWNAAGLYYEPTSTITLTNGSWSLEIASMSVTAYGSSCSVTFDQDVKLVGVGNLAPTLSGVAIDGTAGEGMTLSADYTYNDLDGDLEDTSATQGTITWYQFDNASGSTGETLLGNTITHTVGSSSVGKYIEFQIVPHAQSGTTPGISYTSARVEILDHAYQFQTTKQTNFQLVQTANSSQPIIIDWGDDTRTEYAASGGSESKAKTYSAAGTHIVTVFARSKAAITSVSMINQNLTGIPDFTDCSGITSLTLNTNTGITNTILTGCTGLVTLYRYGCGINVAQDYSAFTSLVQIGDNDNSIPSVTIGSLTSLSILRLHNNSITASIDVSGCSSLTQIWFSNMASVGWPTFGAITTIETIIANSTGISGDIDVSAFSSLKYLHVYSNSGVTDITFPATTSLLYNLRCNGCNIAATELNGIIDQCWDSRTASGSDKRIDITGNPGVGSISAVARDQLDGTDTSGTGTYTGDGLADNGWAIYE